MEKIEEMSYEHAREVLQQTVMELEQGGVSLEESLRLWEYGERLAAHCEKLLVSAKQRFEKGLESEESIIEDASETN